METDYKDRMDRIINWVQVCDTKASIVLTIVLLLTGFIFSSDYVLNGFEEILKNTFFVKNHGSVSIAAIIAIISFFGSVFCLIVSLFKLVLVLIAKPESNQTDDKNVRTESLIHFYEIAKIKEYKDFKKAIEDQKYDEKDDLISQIYINAQRCAEKFDDYNLGVYWTIGLLVNAVIMIGAIVCYLSANAL